MAHGLARRGSIVVACFLSFFYEKQNVYKTKHTEAFALPFIHSCPQGNDYYTRATRHSPCPRRRIEIMNQVAASSIASDH